MSNFVNGDIEVTSTNNQPMVNQPMDNLYRQSSNNAYLSFSERVEKCPYLISFEEGNTLLSRKGQKKKKEIVSYKANRDELFIEKPERPHMPIDIKKNIEEPDKNIQNADLGIQCDEIIYEDDDEYPGKNKDDNLTPEQRVKSPKRKYFPMKIGIDVGTQIEDKDLFNFDREVVPLLTVIVGKTLEQSLNELSQEDELEILKHTKEVFLKKMKEDDNRIKNLEDKENEKKLNNDKKKEKRLKDREIRKKTQRMMICRVMSKYYLKGVQKSAVADLLTRGQFRKYEGITIKDNVNQIIKERSENLSGVFVNLRSYIGDTLQKEYSRKVTKHSKAVVAHKELMQKMKEERERRKKEEEERKKKEEEDRKERRRQRKIARIGKEIKDDLITPGTEKGDILGEEFNEMDNHFIGGTPYIGIYGGYMGMLLVAFSLIKKDHMNSPDYSNLYEVENIGDCLVQIFDSIQGTLNLYFTEEAAAKIKEILKAGGGALNPDVDNDEEDKNDESTININDLKTHELDASVWDKIYEVLADLNNNSDYLLRNFVEEFSETSTRVDSEGNEEMQVDPYINRDFYGLIIKALIELIKKAEYLERFNFIFEEPKKQEDEGDEEKKDEGEQPEKSVKYHDIIKLPFEQKIAKYEAICMIEMAKSGAEYIKEVEFMRNANKKKSVRAPELDNVPPVKAYNCVSERHTILLYDRVAEFVLRNKIFECILAQNYSVLGQDGNDTNNMFNTFNESYDEMINYSKINKLIQIYHYPPEEEKKDEEGEEEQQD